jgi:hypothetical protein
VSPLDAYAGNESNQVCYCALIESRNRRLVWVMHITPRYMQVQKIPFNFNILTNLDQFQLTALPLM